LNNIINFPSLDMTVL